jgi:hypothetical protein
MPLSSGPVVVNSVPSVRVPVILALVLSKVIDSTLPSPACWMNES